MSIRYEFDLLVRRLGYTARIWVEGAIVRTGNAIAQHEQQLRDLDATLNGRPACASPDVPDLGGIVRQLQAWQGAHGGRPLVSLLADAARWADMRAACVANDGEWADRLGQILGDDVTPDGVDAAADQVRMERIARG